MRRMRQGSVWCGQDRKEKGQKVLFRAVRGGTPVSAQGKYAEQAEIPERVLRHMEARLVPLITPFIFY